MVKLISKSCVRCGSDFVPIRPSTRFCSISCSNVARARPSIEKTCVVCERNFLTKNKKTVCCSRKCGRQLAERTIDKESFGRAISVGKTGKTHRGAPHSEKTRTILSERATARLAVPENNPMFGRKHRSDSRDAMSATRTRRIVAGEYDLSGWAKKGEVFSTKANRKISYRSSWEKRAIELLEDDPDVTSFQFEPMRIPYMRVEGGREHLRNYVPDFLVTYANGQKVLIEVKPECYLDAGVNVAKFAAAREWCEQNAATFRVWTQTDLGMER